MTKKQAIDFLKNNPAGFARMLGFDKLREIHNEWIIDMFRGAGDRTLQASRGTYKTTCVCVALSLIVILLPNKRTLFMRKTDTDVKEIIKQVQKILLDPHTQYFVQTIYNVQLKLSVQNATEISTNLTTDKRGTSQLVGIGCGASLTGKHFDYVFTDDIVNVKDRISKAERDHTKIVYQELQNVKNRDGRIFNTGTPWHKEDCFEIMPDPIRYDCYHPMIQEIITPEMLEEIKSKMLLSLFCANYELKHVPSEDVLFQDPHLNAPDHFVEQGVMQLDCAYGGEDYTAWSVMTRKDGKYYIYGKMCRKHVEDCYPEIVKDYERFMCGKLLNEDNADKGMIGKDLRKLGLKVILYHEDMNKFLKIATYLRAIWNDLYFVESTDPEYIEQILEFYEDAAHDDAPDSAASLARFYYGKSSTDYKPLFM